MKRENNERKKADFNVFKVKVDFIFVLKHTYDLIQTHTSSFSGNNLRISPLGTGRLK